jgi:hypothetical protein
MIAGPKGIGRALLQARNCVRLGVFDPDALRVASDSLGKPLTFFRQFESFAVGRFS